jgi:hypothetical protein
VQIKPLNTKNGAKIKKVGEVSEKAACENFSKSSKGRTAQESKNTPYTPQKIRAVAVPQRRSNSSIGAQPVRFANNSRQQKGRNSNANPKRAAISKSPPA